MFLHYVIYPSRCNPIKMKKCQLLIPNNLLPWFKLSHNRPKFYFINVINGRYERRSGKETLLKRGSIDVTRLIFADT